MTYSISVSQPCWFTFLAGTGNFCHRFLPSSCPESIWFLSGRWQLQTSIGNRSGSRSPQKKVVNQMEVRMAGSKDSLKDRLSRYRQSKISVIGRKSGRTISIPGWFVLEVNKLYLLPVQGSD